MFWPYQAYQHEPETGQIWPLKHPYLLQHLCNRLLASEYPSVQRIPQPIMKTLAENFPMLVNFLYHTPKPTQTRSVPLEVICVGISRSGTESLQRALLKLGYDHTYHGFDIAVSPGHHEAWCRLAFKKYSRASAIAGESCITAEDFDPILGNCAAVTDSAGAGFAIEFIQAYPDAKVILNTREDLNKWYASINATFGQDPMWSNPLAHLRTYFSANLYWRRLGLNECWYKFFYDDFEATGKWRYRAHSNEIRGILSKQPERLLEWTVEDGWEPLCRFLGKDIPKDDFPHGNTPKAFAQKLTEMHAANFRRANRNMALFGMAMASTVAAALWLSARLPQWRSPCSQMGPHLLTQQNHGERWDSRL